MQVEIRSHILRCLRDFPQSGEGVITLAGVEHCFMYTVQGDVVDTVIGPPDYVEQVLNERRLNTHEAWSPPAGIGEQVLAATVRDLAARTSQGEPSMSIPRR